MAMRRAPLESPRAEAAERVRPRDGACSVGDADMARLPASGFIEPGDGGDDAFVRRSPCSADSQGHISC